MRLHPRFRLPLLCGLSALFIGGLLNCAGSCRADDAPEQILLVDFDKERLSLGWTAIGGVEAVREELPAAAAEGGTSPSERGVTIKTRGKGGLYTRSAQMPNDWRKFGELSFWVYRSRTEAMRRRKLQLEVQLLEADTKARFWRRVDLTHEGWKEIRVPLDWTRWGGGRIPRWDRIDRIGFWFRDAGELSIDSIAVKQTTKPRAAFVDVDRLKEIAFPTADAVDGRDVRVIQQDGVVILTNVAELDGEQLAGQFAALQKVFLKDFPFLDPPKSLPVLIVFRDRESYQQFAPSFARRLNSASGPPRSTGYTLLGTSHSFWEEKFGTLRPAYTHELVHSLLARTTRLPCRGGWLHEGLASYYQLQFHPQENFPEIVQAGLRDANLRSPLKDICTGKRIEGIRYWQAATLVEFLQKSDTYRPQLPALFEAFRNSGSTDLSPQLEPVLKTTWDQLTAEWIAYCRETF